MRSWSDMDYAACNVVYVDRSAQEDRLVKKEEFSAASTTAGADRAEGGRAEPAPSRLGADENLRTLLGTFSEVHVCTSGKSCIAKLSELNQSSIAELIPTLVLIDIPYDDQLHERPSREVRTPSPNTRDQIGGILEDDTTDAYGLRLLQWISTEIQYQSLSRLVVPVAVVSIPEHSWLAPPPDRGRSNPSPDPQLNFTTFGSRSRSTAGLVAPLDQARTIRYLNTGATDVLTSPLLPERLQSLAIHAYKAHKDASKEQRALLEMKRGRKRSWVGVDDQKPYAYLREAMVSGLMDGICKLGDDDEPLAKVRINIALDRRERVAAAVGSWQFSAHDFTDDELLHSALLMLQHALAMPELEQWRISTENLIGFLVASRSAYNAFVPYHNFRHVVDVLQACFHFLVRLGRLPPFPTADEHPPPPPSPVAELIRPFEALTLLITAIGHDVGHPGVNNAFLVTLNAPLAQLYNDRSVLESFHCAAYSQILRRHWPSAFQCSDMRKLMISSILATDMQLHFEYMKKLGWLQEKLHENGGLDGIDGRTTEDHRSLACSLLIKCADISNVARRYNIASQWTMILTDEFARQASMEEDLGIPTALFAVPVRETIALGKSQLGFMNIFATPLFTEVANVMPGMIFTTEELTSNKTVWEEKIDVETKARQHSEDSLLKDGTFSPRSMSVAHPSDGNVQRSISGTDMRKPLLARAPTNGTLEEEPRHQSMPEIATSSLDANAVSSSETITECSSRSPKPTQLRLSFATASTPGLLDEQGRGLLNGNTKGLLVTPSLVTDPVAYNPPESPKESKPELKRVGGLDGADEGTSTDWTSQATSVTTGKMPLSPSTQGTSVTSDSDSVKKPNDSSSQIITPTRSLPNNIGSECGSHDSPDSAKRSEGSDASTDLGVDGGAVKVEKTRGLRKHGSRFKMNMAFWKRNKSSSPPHPMPVGGHSRVEDDGVQ